jgi:hypothetical protein
VDGVSGREADGLGGTTVGELMLTWTLVVVEAEGKERTCLR